ncbi:armadillo repeat-containing 8-like isoform B [Micractinium conductrix]|uniref:Protein DETOXIFICATION n=1 Tax=Micractinium conductrix TaxID=554055 RepID=A0A2P6VQ27_9CHLO|nr:armadillo repeat-containing 8-like isoform B [Micractinium conductrix]|eukprot:PSC76204.1 armadillo repeat-containing 8-like isoform B [Micractinium conductrix]
MAPSRASSRAAELVAGLHSEDGEIRLQALRGIKNCVIGNKRQKLQYIQLGAVPPVVGVLASPAAAAPALVQAAAALGSFAASEEGLAAVLSHGGIPHLLRVLTSNGDDKVAEAAVRALKAVCRSPTAPTGEVLAGRGVVARLVALLASPVSNVAESAAAVLAACCTGAAEQGAVAAAGAVPPLVALLGSAARSKQEAALEALAALSRGNADTSGAVLEHAGVVGSLLRALKRGGEPHVRFVAAVCLANLSMNLPPGHAQHSRVDLQQAVLPVLVRLLGEAAVGEDVPGALCQLVEGSAELQQAAADADAVARLAAILREPERPARLVEGALRCLATLCADKEEHRRQLVECSVLPQIATALSDPSPPIRAAACMCMRSLSRSTKLLRGHLGEVELAAPLLALAAQGDAAVAAQAVGTLANMAVDFSAVKEQLLRHDGVARFAALAESMSPMLRLHGVWGLSSVAYMSTQEVKAAIMQQLPWGSMAALLEDSEPEVREKAMLLLRNLVYNSEADINAALRWSELELLAAVRDTMQRGAGQSALKQHAMYVIVNMASSTAAHKTSVMDSGWPALLVEQLSDGDERVREAAVWVIINLTWSRDGDAEETAARAQQLRALGVEDKLRSLEHDDSAPSLQDILRFCLPVILVPLADPLMSLIDTVALGRMSDELQLAALGPASLLLTFSNYILFGLSVGTVSLVAERLQRRDLPAASVALASSLFLAAVGGAAMGAVYLVAGPALLRCTGADAAVLAYASSYLRIRALALPAVVVGQVSQAGLLAQRDSLSPFRVVLATSAVSLAGDLLLIGRYGMGVAGAAWTTIFAQYLGAALLLRALRRSRVVPHVRVPSRAELAALLDTFGVLTVFYAAKNLSYLLIQSTAARLPALLLAAHQPVWSLWCLVSFTNTPLESAALAFLPGAFAPADRRATARLLLLLGVASGAVGCAAAVGLPALAPQLFTANAALWEPMQSVALQGVLAMLCCGMDVAATGCLLGIKDGAFVARAMVGCLAVLAGFLWWARQALPGLPAVWWGLTVFFALRASQSVPRAVTQLGLLGGPGKQQQQQAPAAAT